MSIRSGSSMPTRGSACIRGVPTRTFPKISRTSASSSTSALRAPAAWSMRANSCKPCASSASRSRVSTWSTSPLAIRSTTSLTTEEVLRVRGADELLVEQAREVDHGADRPIARDDVLGLPGGVAGYEDDAAERLVVDPGDVVLEPSVVPPRAREVELLRVAIERSYGGHDRPNALGALHGAVQHRTLDGRVVCDVVEPGGVVPGKLRVAARQIPRGAFLSQGFAVDGHESS